MKPGSLGVLETVFRMVEGTVDPVALFQALREGDHGFLLESADIIEKYGDKSVGCVDPALRITLRREQVTLQALNARGRRYLPRFAGGLDFLHQRELTPDRFTGRLPGRPVMQDEDERLQAPGMFDVLRVMAFGLQPRHRLEIPAGGVYGVISYDAIDYFEELPPQPEGGEPELDFYYADQLFVVDHLQGRTWFIANLPVFGEENRCGQFDCQETIRHYERIFKQTGPYQPPLPPAVRTAVPDIGDAEFARLVEQFQSHIAAGDIFQAVLSRTFRLARVEQPLQTYARLKDINPGPYMFFFETPEHTLFGSSPETCLKVSGRDEKTVEIRPIAGTLPRGRRDDALDPELDSRLELDLLQDQKELAEHCMLVDLARNDVARVSVPGSRYAPELMRVEKYSHVQHLVSTVRGRLRPELDALHAYQAAMNMGTLTGAPKIKAMELIRRYERDPRGFYGGSVCYLTPWGEFDSCIIIRAVLARGEEMLVRAGAGVVYDSVPALEARETCRKAEACLTALGGTI